jgi:hypothetical protein
VLNYLSTGETLHFTQVFGNGAKLNKLLKFVGLLPLSSKSCDYPLSKNRNAKIKIKETIVLPAVVYRYETWSLILRGEYRLSVFESRVVRRISGTKT